MGGPALPRGSRRQLRASRGSRGTCRRLRCSPLRSAWPQAGRSEFVLLFECPALGQPVARSARIRSEAEQSPPHSTRRLALPCCGGQTLEWPSNFPSNGRSDSTRTSTVLNFQPPRRRPETNSQGQCRIVCLGVYSDVCTVPAALLSS